MNTHMFFLFFFVELEKIYPRILTKYSLTSLLPLLHCRPRPACICIVLSGSLLSATGLLQAQLHILLIASTIFDLITTFFKITGKTCGKICVSPCGSFCVISQRKGERSRRDSRRGEREGQGRKRNRNESEETEEIKTFPLYPYLLQG